MKSLLLLLLPFSALASTETDLACNLERSKAEVQASVLAAPQAFASLGQDAVTGEKNAQVGITPNRSLVALVPPSSVRPPRLSAMRSPLPWLLTSTHGGTSRRSSGKALSLS